MEFKAEIPYGAYWSTPFARWQGSYASLHSIEFAAHVGRKELARRNIDLTLIDFAVLGISVPQKHAFYGAPWLLGMMGCDKVAGPTVMQACATGVRALLTGALEVQTGTANAAFVVTCDKTSNGPHIYYPNPKGAGGTGSSEDWVMENFSNDPLGQHPMLTTAENVASKHGFSTAEQHEVVLRREAQYQDALKDEAAFLKKFMTLPFEVPVPNFKKVATVLNGDEGVSQSTPEGLAALKPVRPEGTVTFGGQTHPADGNAAMMVTTPELARHLSIDPRIAIKLRGFGLARTRLAFMPEATVPAAQQALQQARLGINQMKAIKTHNPFAVNDLYFAKEMGIDLKSFNNFGCSLVWGHPQAPMGTRSMIELIEELVMLGGGCGLFTGCAAGDSAMAVVLEVVET